MDIQYIYSALENVGLSEKEVRIYLQFLQSGPTSILTISKKTGIHRPALYRLITTLSDKGIIQTSVNHKRKVYFAVPPQQLMNLIRQKEEILRETLPLLENLVGVIKKPRIVYYEGRAQLLELFRTGLESKKKIMRSYFPSTYMIDVFGKKEMERIIKDRIKKDIWVNTLRSTSSDEPFETSEEQEQAKRTIRYIPQEIDMRMGFVLFDNKVNLFSPIEENFGLQIESESYAVLMTCFFDSIWKQSLSRQNNT